MNKQDYLKQIEEVIEKGSYKAEWLSLCDHETPKWYQRAKFGIFIHWGVYSVPAFGYKDLIPLFKGEKFNAREWAELFKKAGARYVMPVAEHHDGFQMYDSDLCRWNTVQMGPCRDVLGELKEAVEERGMVFCTSSHRAEHWWFFDKGREIQDADVNDPEYADLYGPAAGPIRNWGDIFDNPPDDEFMQDWLVRTCELIDKYQPKVLYFDWWIQQYAFKPYLKKMAAYYYNRGEEWGEEVAINAKYDAFVHGSVVHDIERGQLSGISPFFWQNDTSVAKNSWGYTAGNDYKESKEIICDLVDVGAWLEVNGEAIYDTRPWKLFGEGPTEVSEGAFTDTARDSYTSEDIRFTSRGDIIYAIVMKWPEDGIVKIKSIGKKYKNLLTSVRNMEVLGYQVQPHFGFAEQLIVTAKYVKAQDMPVVLKITID